MVILPRTFSSGHVVYGAYVCVCVCLCVACMCVRVMSSRTRCASVYARNYYYCYGRVSAQRLFCMEIDCTVPNIRLLYLPPPRLHCRYLRRPTFLLHDCYSDVIYTHVYVYIYIYNLHSVHRYFHCPVPPVTGFKPYLTLVCPTTFKFDLGYSDRQFHIRHDIIKNSKFIITQLFWSKIC